MLINTGADAVVDIHILRRTPPTWPRIGGSGGQSTFPTGAPSRTLDPHQPCLTGYLHGPNSVPALVPSCQSPLVPSPFSAPKDHSSQLRPQTRCAYSGIPQTSDTPLLNLTFSYGEVEAGTPFPPSFWL